jgi:hypothetical protein
MCDVHGAFSIRRGYAYAIGARHLELLLDYILLPRRRWWCLPPKYPMYVGLVSYLHATVSPILPKNVLYCMSQFLSNSNSYSETSRTFSHACYSLPYSFHFFSAFREYKRAYICSFFGPTQQEISAVRRNKRLLSNFFFPTRKRVSNTYLSDEKLSKTCSKEKKNFVMNGITIVSTTSSTGRPCIHFDYGTPVLRENVNVHVRTLDKKHKNKFLSPPSTWAWSEQPTSLPVLSASERCTTTKSYVPTFTSTNNILNTRKRYYLYAQKLKFQMKRVNKTIRARHKQPTPKQSVLWTKLFMWDWLLDNHEALLPAEPRP